jgi:hypothetical protein
MAQTNYTPIILYNSGTTTNAPSASNLASGELAINYTDGKLFYKDNSSAIQVIGWKTTPTTAGGTGLTSYTAGDLPYYASGSALSKLGIGTSGYVLQSNGSAPTWVAQSTLTVGTATNATNTAITDNTSSSATWYPTIVSATTGNLPQTTSSTKLSFVPNTGTLTATAFSGSGASLTGISLTSGVSGTLPILNGGTGQTSFTSGQIHYGSFSTSSNLTFDGTNLTATGIQNTPIGGTTPNTGAFTTTTVRSGAILYLNRSDNNAYNTMTYGSGDVFLFNQANGGNYSFQINGTTIFGSDASGNFIPGADNTKSNGSSSKRWSVIYSATALINTSDANQKQQIESLTTAEIATAKTIKGLFKTFKFNNAVAKKGENARTHIGVMAQDVQSAFTANGLDATKYGLFCSDIWYVDENGNTYESTVDKNGQTIPNLTQVNQLGVRYEELLCFVMATL